MSELGVHHLDVNLLFHHESLVLDLLPYAFVEVSLGLLLQELLVHRQSLPHFGFLIHLLPCQRGLIVVLLRRLHHGYSSHVAEFGGLLVDVLLEGLLREPVVEVVGYNVSLLLLPHLLHHLVGLGLQLGVDWLLGSRGVEEDILLLLGSLVESVDLLDLSLPWLHVHLSLSLLHLHLLQLLLTVNELIQEPRPIRLHHHDCLLLLRHGCQLHHCQWFPLGVQIGVVSEVIGTDA